MIALVTLLALTPLDFYATHWPRSVRAALTAGIVLAIAGWSIGTSRANRAPAMNEGPRET